MSAPSSAAEVYRSSRSLARALPMIASRSFPSPGSTDSREGVGASMTEVIALDIEVVSIWYGRSSTSIW